VAILRICILLLLSFLVIPVRAEDTITAKLEEVLRKYQAAMKEPQNDKLKIIIELDQNLRLLIDKPWTLEHKSVDKQYWKAKYQTIGVFIGHYSDSLEYRGKLLREAKALDRDSKYGAYTLYADVCDGAGSFSGTCQMPNISAALTYEIDFPNGPFIEDVLVTIGNFYDDLYKALKERDLEGYKYGCFSEFMNDKPIPLQLENARKLAINYYTKVLALQSNNKAANRSIEEWKANLESGDSDGWHFCGD
jgi:hypothetical protein